VWDEKEDPNMFDTMLEGNMHAQKLSVYVYDMATILFFKMLS
jgi:hypothetical protein